jgi:hypothetical protein
MSDTTIQSPELQSALDENTPSQRLRELAQIDSDYIRFAVAENPNTSEIRTQNVKMLYIPSLQIPSLQIQNLKSKI